MKATPRTGLPRLARSTDVIALGDAFVVSAMCSLMGVRLYLFLANEDPWREPTLHPELRVTTTTSEWCCGIGPRVQWLAEGRPAAESRRRRARGACCARGFVSIPRVKTGPSCSLRLPAGPREPSADFGLPIITFAIPCAPASTQLEFHALLLQRPDRTRSTETGLFPSLTCTCAMRKESTRRRRAI
jgi:hypothetical protein